MEPLARKVSRRSPAATAKSTAVLSRRALAICEATVRFQIRR